MKPVCCTQVFLHSFLLVFLSFFSFQTMASSVLPPWTSFPPPRPRASSGEYERGSFQPLPPPSFLSNPSTFQSLSYSSVSNKSSPAPLAPYVAKIVALNAQQTDMECPITLASMKTCSTLHVPTCGHVCSDAKAKSLASCPVCRAKVGWTTVTM